jgi:LysM repeat protein
MNVTDTRAVCIGVGSASTTTTASSTGTATQTSSTMGPTPTDTVAGCQKFYTVVDGDDCASIESEFDITLAQFYAWNPSVGSQCTNLWLEEPYCVKGPASSTATSISTTTTIATTPSAPTQTGISSDCNVYYTVGTGDSCGQIETTYGITFAELYKWNPAIGSDCEYLDVGYSVCVGVSS